MSLFPIRTNRRTLAGTRLEKLALAAMIATSAVAMLMPVVSRAQQAAPLSAAESELRALLLLLAIALPWYVAILLKEGRGFVEGFFLKHNVSRFSGPISGHGGSLLYYFPVVLLLSLPFTALLVPVAQRIRDVWRDDLQTYLLLWFAFVFVFFSLSGTKLPHYLLYGYTGLVLLMALHGFDVKRAS